MGVLTAVLIVSYHAIASPASAVAVPPDRFERDLHALRDAGYAFVSLDRCADWLAGACALPDRAAVITFDDGYASVAIAGLPVLQRLGAAATVFVIAGRLGGDNQWPGQAAGIPPMPLVDAGALRELVHAGIAVGSHSWSHAVLTRVSTEALRAEMIDSADRLEQLLQVPVRHFAYPYGERGSREVALAHARYATAVSAASRLVARDANPHDLPRLDAHDLHVAQRLRLLGAAPLAPYLAARRSARQLRRASARILGR